ncbi:MAG: hypothetical protein ACO2PK_08355 [Armatimonadota bacterium]
MLAKRGIPKEVAEAILRELAREAGDNEVKDRLRALMDTYDRPTRLKATTLKATRRL